MNACGVETLILPSESYQFKTKLSVVCMCVCARACVDLCYVTIANEGL